MSSKAILGCFLFLCLAPVSMALAQEMVIPLYAEFSEFALTAQRHELAGEDYDLIEVQGIELTGAPGVPCLPVRVMYVYVPAGMEARGVRIRSLESQTVPVDCPLLPMQVETPLASHDAPAVTLPDPEIYASAAPYPGDPVELAHVGTMAGRRVATVNVYPVQYIPAEHEMDFNRALTFDLVLEEAPAHAQAQAVLPAETASVRNLRNGIVRSMVENPADVEADFPTGGTLDPSGATEYLVLCPAAHADEYAALCEWKTRKGVPAGVKTFEEISAGYAGRDAQEQIRNCIKDYYLNHSTVWVVLACSAPKARIRGCYCDVWGTVDDGIPCDLYFADTDGDWNQDGDGYWGETTDDVDLYPDVYAGRIPANTGVQCSTAIHKVLTYEGRFSTPTDYQRKALFMAEYADASTDCAATKNMIDNESVPSRFDPIAKLYESSGNLNHASAMSALNSGPGLVNHAGHGNTNLLSIGPDVLVSEDMSALTNAPRYSVFYTLACDPGNFENVMGCFARSFVLAPGGGGFFVGNSRYGWYWPGNPGYGTGDLFDREFFKSMFVRNHDNLGVIHADAKVQRIPWSGDDDTDRWTQFSMNLFGDPETPVWKDTPKALAVSHPAAIEIGGQTFTVSVSSAGAPLAAARVCLWKGTEVYAVDETGTGGGASFQISPSDSGTMLVTVVKNGYLPYLGSSQVEDNSSGIGGDVLAGPARLTVRPNPTVGAATISWSIATPQAATLEGAPVLNIYDASGRLVRSLTPPETGGAGRHAVGWDGRAEAGARVPPGIYFVRVSGSGTYEAKLVVLR